METPKDKIKMIMERLGMSGTIAAKAMSMPDSTFRKKVMPSLPHITFTEKNHSDLVDFLIDEIQFLVIYKKTNEIEINAYSNLLEKIKDSFKNYDNYRKLDDWNLFDELKSIVDSMETHEIFGDISHYTTIINTIEQESALLKNEPNIFTVKKYNSYALGDKKKNHFRWFNYIDYSRQQKIKALLDD